MRSNVFFRATEAMPVRMTIRVRGTVTILNQCTVGNQLCWIGHPMSEAGDTRCQVALVVSDTGQVPFGPALNFIADGGKKGQYAERSVERIDETRLQLQAAWQYHATQHYPESLRTADVEDLGGDLGQWLSSAGFSVVVAEETPEDELLCAYLGVAQEVLALCRHYGWVLVPNFQVILENRVPTNYARVEEGEWDDVSATIAVTNRLTAGEVLALRTKGMCFRRTKARRSAEA